MKFKFKKRIKAWLISASISASITANFKEAEQNDKARSTHALLVFQDIYEQERQMKDLTVEQRQALRQEVILPKLQALHAWMIKEYQAVTPTSPIGKALS
ncbi:MAG: transposase [Chryseolinea sp.]